MTLPRSLVPARTSNIVRRGRYNTRMQEDSSLLTGAGADPAPGGDSEAPSVPLAYLYQVVADYVDAHPAEFADACPYGGGTWDFLDGVVAALRAADERVGYCWRPERNDYAGDAVTYYHGPLPPVEDSNDVYTVDIIIESCSVDAAPSWNDVTSPAVVRAWRELRV